VGIWDNSKKGYYTRIAGAMEAGQDERADELWGYITSAGGATESAAKTGVKSAIKTGVIAGDIDAGRAEQVLEDRLGVKEGQGFWTVREWQGGDDYTKYSDFLSAVETGKNLRDTIKLYTDHGVSASTLKSQITEKYKPIYRDMYKKDKNQALTLKSHIVNAFEALGDKRDDANKKVQKWLED